MNAQNSADPIRILLVVDKSDDIGPLRSDLQELAPFSFSLDSTTNFREALHRISRQDHDLILLDVALFAGSGFEMFVAIKEQANDVPIVVLTTQDDESLAIRAVDEGAQDYIVKGHVNKRHLVHSLQYAVTRQNLLKKLVNQSHIDELTGLYNRRGFMDLAQQQLRVCDRSKRSALMFFVDLDRMKQINDRFGHSAGDNALRDASAVLRTVFRKSDIIARIGGDEFAVLAIEIGDELETLILNRLAQTVTECNGSASNPYQLGLSAGCAVYTPDECVGLGELMDRADKAMYEHKKHTASARHEDSIKNVPPGGPAGA